MNRTVTIASIYPLEVVEERPGYIPVSTFRLPAAKPGEVSYLRVVDSEIQEYVGYDRSIRTADKTTADKIANDLVNVWTRGFPGITDAEMARPGIMKIAGDTITDEEMETLMRVQGEFARRTVLDADLSHTKGLPNLITKRHHMMAAWLKVKNRPWQEVLDRTATKACPFCHELNHSAASKCKNCREIIDRDRYEAISQSLKAGKAGEVDAAMEMVQNMAEISVESLSSSDVDELLREQGITAAAGAGGKKR